MLKDERDLLDVLKFELYFLRQRGYERTSKTSWRPPFIFEGSPTCMNYAATDSRRPCSDCVLMQLVPLKHRTTKTPCRHIPLNECGDTLKSLYKYTDQNQIEETLKSWMDVTIQHLEEQRMAAGQDHDNPQTGSCELVIGTPLYQRLHSKCANPACPTFFHWTGGGKFFRFRPDPISQTENRHETDTPGGAHGLRHYWLCEKCCHILTLLHDDVNGVEVKLLWTELPPEKLLTESQ